MISRRHGCIFVHVPKTAGQSVETAFLHDQGLDWQARDALLLTPNSDPRRGPPRLAHLTLDEYVTLGHVGDEDFARSFKFAFVRNPWSRAVSFYRSMPFNAPFGVFVDEILGGLLWEEEHWFVRPQADYVLSRRGGPGLDFIGRFERLAEDFSTVAARVGLAAGLPSVNVSGAGREGGTSPLVRALLPGIGAAQRIAMMRHAGRRKDTFPTYREYYDDTSRERVAQLYASDIEAFGYEF